MQKTACKALWERERPTFSCEKDKREHQMPVIRVEEVPLKLYCLENRQEIIYHTEE